MQFGYFSILLVYEKDCIAVFDIWAAWFTCTG